MGERLTRLGPLAASLMGHLALLAAVAGAAALWSPRPRPLPALVPVRLAPEEPARTGLRLLLETPGAASEPDAGETAVSLDSADRRYRPYLTAVKRRIWERWGVPELRAGQSARGTLVVEFTLTRSGRLAGSGVLEPSGTPALDRAALDAVARAVPFTPLPASIAGDTLRVRARFTYD